MTSLGKKCNGCHAYYNICSKDAISMNYDCEGFLRPQINKDKCIHCDLCLKVCPLIHQNRIRLYNEPAQIAFAAKAKKYQLNSTSGGFFSALANEIIKNGGIVYGAAYTNNFHVMHVRIDNIDGLHHLADSKYTQSEIGSIFVEVKNDLQNHLTVLFSGTACQIAGLRNYLVKDYDNLITVDVICHGVASPFIWNNPYMLGFLKDIYLRNSCHECVFKNKDVQRVSDFTIGDFWGCENEETHFFDADGVSLVLSNTCKANEIIKSCDWCVIKKTNMRNALKYNVAVYNSYMKPKSHNLFWKEFNTDMTLNEFSNLIDKCVQKADKEKKSLKTRLKRKVQRMLLK